MSTDQLFVVTYDNEQWLIKAEKQSKPSKTITDDGRSKTSVLECSEVIFRDAEKCRTSRHRTRKPRSTLKVEAIRSRWSQIVKSQIEKSITK